VIEFLVGKRRAGFQVKCTNGQSGPNAIIVVLEQNLFIPCLFCTSLMHTKYLQFNLQFIASHWQKLF